MSVPSFASFPQRAPSKVPRPVSPPTLPRFISQTTGHDESVVAGPSFSSFPSSKDSIRSRDRNSSEKKSRKGLQDTSREGSSRHRRRDSSRSRTRSTRDPVREREREQERDDLRKRSRSNDRNGDYARSSRDGRQKDPLYKGSQDVGNRKRDLEKRRDKADRGDLSTGKETSAIRGSPAANLILDPKEFYTDTRGDQDILRFGPQRGMKYIPSGRGRVVGLSEAYRLDSRDAGGGRGVEVRLKSDATDEMARGSTLEALSGPVLRLKYPRADASREIDTQADYVAIGRKKRKIALAEEPKDRVEAFWDEEEQRKEKPSDDQAESEEEEIDVELEETEEQTRRRVIVDFERKLKDGPEDVEMWIAYAQLHLTKGPAKSNPKGLKGKPEQVSTAKRAEAEVATEILSKAFRASGKNKSDPRLHSAFFKLVQLFWPEHRVTASWKSVLSEMTERGEAENQAGLMNLWLEYIEWREGRGLGSQKSQITADGQSGGIEDVIEVYIECIGIMRAAKAKSGTDVRFLEENLVYLLLRGCLLLKHAGYMERATAIMQAMLELTFFKPGTLRRTMFTNQEEWHEQLFSSLEAWWDSELPRIGETGSQGWMAWDQRQTYDPEATVDSPVAITGDYSTVNPYERWYQDETATDKQHARPARALDLADDDEDPYRTVLFSDVDAFLFVIEEPDVKLQFAYAALNLLGLSVAPPGIGSDAALFTDPHLSWSLDVHSSRLWPGKTSTHEKSLMTEGMDVPVQRVETFISPLKAWAIDEETVCTDTQPWFASIDKAGLADCDLELVINILKRLQTVVLEPAFKTAYLAVESIRNRKGATRAAKAMIESDQQNFELYASYARVLRQQGKIKEARQVYAMCLQAQAGTAEVDVGLQRFLVFEWAWMEYRAGADQESLNVVLLVANDAREIDLENLGRPPSAVAVLRARRAFSETVRDNLDWNKLQYLFRTLQEPFEEVFKSLSVDIQLKASGTPEQERLGQFACQLAWNSQRRKHFSPTLIRTLLEYLISVFPSNTIFLSLFLANESGSQIYGRVHRMIEDAVLNTNDRSAILHLWAAWAEARSDRGDFWSSSSAAAERVRHVFDKALDVTGTARRSLAIWKAYIEFEALQGRSESAKQLCYRALGEIGTAKALYMLPFSPSLRPFFSEKELQDWAEVMVEKGVRVRLPFERYWRTVTAVDFLEKDDGGDPMKEEDRVFDFLRDRQTLMPY